MKTQTAKIERPDKTVSFSSAVDSERFIVAKLIEKQDCFFELNGLRPEHFYDDDLRLIFSALIEMFEKSVPIDIATIADFLLKNNLIEKLKAGVSLIAALSDVTISVTSFKYHILLVKEKYLRRTGYIDFNGVKNQFSDETVDLNEAISTAETVINKIYDTITGEIKEVDFATVLSESLKDAETAEVNAKVGVTSGIATNTAVDELTGGWQNGDLIIIAARPSMGKTAVMLQFVKEAAKQNIEADVVSLEMTKKQLAARLICGEANINPDSYKFGKMSLEMWQKVEGAATVLSRLKIVIHDESLFADIFKIVALMKKKCRDGKRHILFIDYLQLMNYEVSSGLNKNDGFGKVALILKTLAKELNIPVVLLCQLNREVERRTDKRPWLSDLRDSGELEQHADIIAFLYRPAYYEKNVDMTDPENRIIEIIFAKNRNGRTGEVYLQHNEYITNFETEQMPFFDDKRCPAF